jgi:hypothetical protein
MSNAMREKWTRVNYKKVLQEAGLPDSLVEMVRTAISKANTAHSVYMREWWTQVRKKEKRKNISILTLPCPTEVWIDLRAGPQKGRGPI